MLKQNHTITPVHVIQTKLYRPQAPAPLVNRPYLLARLDQGLRHTLILVSAPPGFGKTSLASQWLAAAGRPAGWLSLDAGDNQPAQFLRYLCAAVRRTIPEACGTLHDLPATLYLPELDYLASLLVDDLHALPTDFILVLDDYQRIRSPAVHALMRRLLHYRPPRLHLVILTRSDPPLSLGRLRLSQQITEIRAADLRFDLDDTRRLLQAQTGHPLDEGMIESLQARTEGWVIGLQLAGISLQHLAPDEFLTRFGGSHRLLVGYLVEEVMAGLPAAVTAFLTRTALVDRFCAPLGDALLAGSHRPVAGQEIIAQLEAQNMFIVPLDDTGTWYRYHDLFRDFLLHRLTQEQGPAGLADLHRRAGEWLAQAGLIEDALRHILAAGDENRAADLVEVNLQPLLNQQVPAPVLVRWLDLFPEQIIRAHPGLLTAQTFLFIFRWDMAAIGPAIDQARTVAEADGRVSNERRCSRLAVLDMLEGYRLYWQGEMQQAIPLLQRCLDHLKDQPAYSFTAAVATQFLALATASCGQQQTALTVLRTALAEATSHHRPVLMILLGARAGIQLYAGNLDEAAATAGQMLDIADLNQTHSAWSGVGLVQVWRGWAHYFLGSAHYEQNGLDAAAQHWQQVEAMRYRVNPGALHNSLVGLALIAQAQGQEVQALAYAQAAREFAGELRSPPLRMLSEALEARLALLDGNQADALRRAQEINTAANQGTAIWLEPPPLTVLRTLLTEGTPESLTTARPLAETCLQHAEAAHNTRQIIQVVALQALIRQASGRLPDACDALERALTLGAPGSFTRTFLDLGAPMAELLAQFERQRSASPHLQRLLASFARELDHAGGGAQAARHRHVAGITPLTPRELELLALIAQRLTVKEMAEQMVILPNTVKQHVSNIYAKLGVHNRRQAIARAREAGLLPSD